MPALTHRKLFAALWSLMILSRASVWGQPTAWVYQGQLESGGAPADGLYELRFALFDAASNGVQQGFAVTNAATAVTRGLFNVTLDFGANVFTGDERWLEIGVTTNGGGPFTPLSPRQRIASAPYAVRAIHAQAAAAASRAGSVAASNIVGTIALPQLPTGVLTNGASGVNLAGTLTGDGVGITNIDVRQLQGENQKITGWGTQLLGVTSIPNHLGALTTIAAGARHNLALKQDGTVVGWGDNTSGQTAVPAGLAGVVAIAAGGAHSLALKRDGTVVAWGANNYGQSTVPSGLSNVVAVAGGYWHSLALRDNGTVVVWGLKTFGQGDVPPGLTNVVAIAAGVLNNFALTRDGTVIPWGSNALGQNNVPAGLSNVVAIAAGNQHGLALKQNGTVVGWGGNSRQETEIPPGLTNAVAIAAGNYHNLALRSDGTVVAWGENGASRLNPPVGLSKVVAIAAGDDHSLALSVTPKPSQLSLPDGNQVFTGMNVFSGVFLGSPPYLKFTEQQPKGTAAGGNVAGVNVRRFTHRVIDTHQLGSLDHGDIILPPGTYQCRISAPGYRVDEHQIRLRTTSGAVLLYGTSEFSDDALNPGVQSRSLLQGRFTITVTMTNQVEHHMAVPKTGNGLGLPTGATWTDGNPVEVYAVAEFWKIQ